MNEREIYLDNSATTKACKESVEAVVHAMQEEYGNAASLHKKGYQAERLLTAAKKEIATVLSCTPQELFFTSGATESNNLAIIGGAYAGKRRGNKIVTTAIEHASVLESVAYLKQQGYEVVQIAPDSNGIFHSNDFFDAVDEKTILVTAMMVNNEVGLRLPITEIGKAIKRKNPQVLFHVDAVQGFLKYPIKLRNSPIDLLSVSAHKVHGPKGIGLLYRKRGTRLLPLLYGGGQQEGVRPGTDAVALVAGFGEAVRVLAPKMQENLEHFTKLRDLLRESVRLIPQIHWNSPEHAVPYIVNLSVEQIRSEIMLHYLEQSGIYVSSGSACSKGAQSHVLKAMGCSDQQVDTALRISFSQETTKEDLDALVQALQTGITSLVKMK